MTAVECKQVFAMLSQYLDRDLPADLCDRIGDHIGECPPCVEFVRSLERTVELCRKFEIEHPGQVPAEVRDKLLEAYRNSLGATGSQ